MGADRKYIFRALFFPLLFVALLWVVKLAENFFNINLLGFGLYPRSFSGAIGIFTAPLIHSNMVHLFSNTIPLLFLGSITFLFYRSIAFQVFSWVYMMTGVWVWAAARDSYHIGSSGIVYGFVCFLFFSGIFRKDTKLLALSLLVTFVYGGLVWGVLPIQDSISWESHLLGSLAGITTAYYYRKEGPQPHRYAWEDEEDEADPRLHDLNQGNSRDIPINYIFKPSPRQDTEVSSENKTGT